MSHGYVLGTRSFWRLFKAARLSKIAWRATVDAFRTFLADAGLSQEAFEHGNLPNLKGLTRPRNRSSALPSQAGHLSNPIHTSLTTRRQENQTTSPLHNASPAKGRGSPCLDALIGQSRNPGGRPRCGQAFTEASAAKRLPKPCGDLRRLTNARDVSARRLAAWEAQRMLGLNQLRVFVANS